MASQVLIAAHDNNFNRAVLDGNGYYFNSSKDVQQLIEAVQPAIKEETMTLNNFMKIKNSYNWPLIIDQYEKFIVECHSHHKKLKTLFIIDDTTANKDQLLPPGLFLYGTSFRFFFIASWCL